MIMSSFSEHVQDALEFYVYRLVDPRDAKTFYVGKGRGNRVFAHIAEASAADLERIVHKLDCIREIKAAGKEVVHVIHRHGLTEKEAYEVEAALLDTYTDLANLQGGYHSDERGAMTATEINAIREPRPAHITEKVVLINIRREWYRGIPAEILYERTCRYWYCNPLLHSAEYAMAICYGVIREVYRIDDWTRVDLSKVRHDPTRKAGGKGLPARKIRWEFKGRPSIEMQRYVSQSVRHLQAPGAQNPIKWVNC